MSLVSIIIVLIVSLVIGIIISLFVKGWSHRLPIILSFISVGIACYFLYINIEISKQTQERENENLINRYYIDITSSLINNDLIPKDIKNYLLMLEIANVIDNIVIRKQTISNSKYDTLIQKLANIPGFKSYWEQNYKDYNFRTNKELESLWL